MNPDDSFPLAHELEPAILRGGILWTDIESARRLSARIHPSRKWKPLQLLQRSEVT